MDEKFKLRLPVLCIIVLLHFFIVYLIHKRKLSQNRYHLIKILTILDASYVISSILVFAVVENHIQNILMLEIISSTTYSIGLASYFVIVLLTLDRYLAIKYCLRYEELVTKRKINVAIIVSSCLIFTDMFLSVRYSTTLFTEHLVTTIGTLSFKVCFQSISCGFILVFGFLVNKLRKSSISATRKLTVKYNNRGNDTQKVSFLESTKRSIKDIFILNMWTVLFTLPNIIVNSIMMTSRRDLRRYEGITLGLYILSNPFLYLLTQTELRMALKKFLKRRKIDTTTGNSTSTNATNL